MTITTQAFLFDMDGVLISSIASAVRCWRKWARQYDVPDADRVEIAHGTRARDIMLHFKPEWRDAPNRETLLADALRTIEDLEIEDVADLKVLPGVRELLAALPPERWSIVTSATRRLLLGRLNAAGLPVPDRIICGDDVKNGKPHPEPYQTGARLLGFPSAACLVVEDAPSGIGSGLAAGSPVLAVLGTHSLDQLRAATPTYILQSLANLQVAVSPGGLHLTFQPS